MAVFRAVWQLLYCCEAGRIIFPVFQMQKLGFTQRVSDAGSHISNWQKWIQAKGVRLWDPSLHLPQNSLLMLA